MLFSPAASRCLLSLSHLSHHTFIKRSDLNFHFEQTRAVDGGNGGAETVLVSFILFACPI